MLPSVDSVHILFFSSHALHIALSSTALVSLITLNHCNTCHINYFDFLVLPSILESFQLINRMFSKLTPFLFAWTVSGGSEI